MLTLNEAAEQLGITRGTMIKLLQEHKLKGVQGRGVNAMIPESAVEQRKMEVQEALRVRRRSSRFMGTIGPRG